MVAEQSSECQSKMPQPMLEVEGSNLRPSISIFEFANFRESIPEVKAASKSPSRWKLFLLRICEN